MTDPTNRFGHLQTLPDGPFRFIALDVETASRSASSICQIGLCFVTDTGSMQTYSVLIDPEEAFAPFNSELHGISAGTVRDAATFPTVYVALFDLLNSHSLVQHSTFDEKALTAACARYDLPMLSSHWTNSVKVARQAWPALKGAGGHGLANLKKHLDLSFHHHDAGEDARAAACVILKAEETTGERLSHLKTKRQLNLPFT
ncbi:exonuclease domain-containing protein [Shimia haliotis]|uniref:DNA polymerase-3 subunit epsilon n=1 Tax=Shimia haliotis TaxID=1280847 RepID=A0A1I4GP65_9RHOB|nr:exonuclease domain-containing protein [Shimia haliotis]SFL31167.1 DNA polymerase-3 subunit epsilon [Shimia haliotis]